MRGTGLWWRCKLYTPGKWTAAQLNVMALLGFTMLSLGSPIQHLNQLSYLRTSNRYCMWMNLQRGLKGGVTLPRNWSPMDTQICTFGISLRNFLACQRFSKGAAEGTYSCVHRGSILQQCDTTWNLWHAKRFLRELPKGHICVSLRDQFRHSVRHVLRCPHDRSKVPNFCIRVSIGFQLLDSGTPALRNIPATAPVNVERVLVGFLFNLFLFMNGEATLSRVYV